MDKHIVNKCSDCFHYKACKAMLVSFGLADYIMESAGADRCSDFVPAADVAIVRNGGWVPVAERRPNGECLAISMIPGPTYKEMLVGRIGKSEEQDTGYVCESDGVILPNVTHWMQPEPPKEGQS